MKQATHGKLFLYGSRKKDFRCSVSKLLAQTKSQKQRNHAISVKNRHVLDLHHSVRPALYEEHHYVLVDFLVTNLTGWHEEGAIIHLNSTTIL